MNEESAGPERGRNEEDAQDASPPAEIGEIADGVFARRPQGSLSPSLCSDRENAAFELKFQLFQEQAREIAAWAARHLHIDPHADPARNNGYLVHGLYFDTPAFDVYHRAPGYRKRKYRLRRYGENETVFLEQKRKSGGKVAKRRVQVAPAEVDRLREIPVDIDWTGHWFHRRIVKRLLQPACLISYERQAFFGHNEEGPLRLTLDRNVRTRAATGWNVTPICEGPVLLPDQVLLELKFHRHLPALFRAMIQDFSLSPGPFSKYRLAVQATGRVSANGRPVDA